jgi:hypothetical protein
MASTETGSNNQIKLIRRLYDRAKRHRNDAVGNEWAESEKYLQGIQLKDISLKKWQCDASANLILPVLRSILSALMRDIPYAKTESAVPGLDNEALHVETLVNRVLRRNRFMEVSEPALLDGLTHGRSYFDTGWDRRMRGGLGEIRVDHAPTKQIYHEPGKASIRDCNYYFRVKEIDKLSLLHLYPNRKADIDQAFKDDKKIRAATGEPGSALYAGDGIGPYGPSTSFFYQVSDTSHLDRQTVEMIDLWTVDETTIERFGTIVEVEGGRAVRKKRKRNFKQYPTGRFIRIIGNAILEDRPNPFPAFPLDQYTNMAWIGEKREFSHGEFVQLIGLQDIFDTFLRQMVDGMSHVIAGGKIAYEEGSGYDAEEDENRPGQRIPVLDVTRIKQLEGARMPPEAFNALGLLRQLMDHISGVSQIGRGDLPGDLRSGFALHLLYEIAQGELKLKTFSLEAAVRGLVEQIIRMIGLYYVPGVHYSDEVNLYGISPEFFDITVAAGLSLPASRETRFQRAMMLHKAGIADEEFVLNSIKDEPGMADEIGRLRQFWERKRIAGDFSAGGGSPDLGLIEGGA